MDNFTVDFIVYMIFGVFSMCIGAAIEYIWLVMGHGYRKAMEE